MSTTNYDSTSHCEKCGKPFCYVGDVPEGGWVEGFAPYCTCNVKKASAPYGWICPKCGASMSPFTSLCINCSPPPKVTC